MNNVNLEQEKLKRTERLKKYGLDQENIEICKGKIKFASDIDREKYGQELLNIISNKEYDEEVEYDKVVELILLGADIECRTEKKGNFPLLICAIRGYLKTAITLLKFGANIDQTNNYETTLTMACARHGDIVMLEISLLMGADINKRCIDGDNAITSALMHGQSECFDMLAANQAYLNNRNLSNKTLLDIESNKYSEICSISKSLEQSIIEKSACEDDALALIEEATNKMKQINNIEVLTNNQSALESQGQKRRAFLKIN